MILVVQAVPVVQVVLPSTSLHRLLQRGKEMEKVGCENDKHGCCKPDEGRYRSYSKTRFEFVTFIIFFSWGKVRISKKQYDESKHFVKSCQTSAVLTLQQCNECVDCQGSRTRSRRTRWSWRTLDTKAETRART